MAQSEGREGLSAAELEAQWEYACRAGSATRYCFGDDDLPLGRVRLVDVNSRGTTDTVGQKKPNARGLYDMHGNVWEWCGDWFADDYYQNSSPSDPTGPATGSHRVDRGGGGAVTLGTAVRRTATGTCSGERGYDLGFRVSWSQRASELLAERSEVNIVHQLDNENASGCGLPGPREVGPLGLVITIAILATLSANPADGDDDYYKTKQEAVQHVPAHVSPKSCFVWNDGQRRPLGGSYRGPVVPTGSLTRKGFAVARATCDAGCRPRERRDW